VFTDCEHENADLLEQLDELRRKAERAMGSTMRIMELDRQVRELQTKLDKAMKAIALLRRKYEHQQDKAAG
jgi:predicted RNase H-like nuclease (RuvC/YqgF family)